MRKLLAATLGVLLAVAGVVPAYATGTLLCNVTAICFSKSSTLIPFQGFFGSIPRGVCHNLTAPNATRWITNNTGTQWRVWTGPNCTGTSGIIFSHSDGPMAGIYYDNLESTYRTSAL